MNKNQNTCDPTKRMTKQNLYKYMVKELEYKDRNAKLSDDEINLLFTLKRMVKP